MVGLAGALLGKLDGGSVGKQLRYSFKFNTVGIVDGFPGHSFGKHLGANIRKLHGF